MIMPKKAALAITAVMCVYVVCAYPTHANTWTAPDGSASADIVNNFGTTYTVTLRDLEANPTSVAQDLSGLSITFQNQVVPIAPFYQGDAVTVGANGTASYSPGAIYGESGPWSMTSNKAFTAAIVAASGAAYSLIGPPGPDGTYSNANGSIADNPAHNALLSLLTWSFELIPVTGDTGPITGVNFSFLDGHGIAGIDPPDAAAVPGPIAGAGLPGLTLLASGGLLALARRRRRRTV